MWHHLSIVYMHANGNIFISIKRTAPGYRGKPENFDLTKFGKRNIPKPPPKSKAGPKSPMLPPPSHLQSKESPQKNDSLITEAIFGGR